MGLLETANFDYYLPAGYIAQQPPLRRDACRLLVVNRSDNNLSQKVFKDIAEFLMPSDCLVFNDTKVLPARLAGEKISGARIEFLLLKEISRGLWETLVKPAKRLKQGTVVVLGEGEFKAIAIKKMPKGTWLVQLVPPRAKELMHKFGVMPTPHYIKKTLKDSRRYQTVYACHEGAIAAPTAGLHFTHRFIRQLKQRGVRIVYITLYVGLGTFRSIKADNLNGHKMDEEAYSISSPAASAINEVKAAGGRIVAVGTTVIRALESAAKETGGVFRVEAGGKVTSLFIKPGYRFKIVNALLTNFHVPRSTNLVLASVFGGLSRIKKAYIYAIEHKFRFYSFGDCMLIV